MNENDQQIMFVNAFITPTTNYYSSSDDGLTNIRNDSVLLSISWKSVNSNKILTLELTWEEQYTTSKKEHHVISLPKMPLIHDLFIMAITPSP